MGRVEFEMPVRYEREMKREKLEGFPRVVWIHSILHFESSNCSFQKNGSVIPSCHLDLKYCL